MERIDTSFEGIPVRYWTAGEGPPLLMLHGTGPGASTKGNWRLVIDQLAEKYRVIAGDLIGFGESGRKPDTPYFDFGLWQRQSAFMLGLFGEEKVNVIGHSLSGALALKLAAHDPRVAKVMTTGSVGAPLLASEATRIVWSFPHNDEELRKVGSTLVYDTSVINDTYIAGRKAVLYQGDYESYFSSMFSGDHQEYLNACILSAEELAQIECPVLLIHGRDDQPTPIASSKALATRIPHADFFAVGRCGHSFALEHPGKLVALASMFFG